MAKTIGNPLSWTAHRLADASGHIAHSVGRIGGDERIEPRIRAMTLQDIRQVLRAGLDDFGALRTDVMFIVLMYPIIGVLLVFFASNANLMHLVFPMIAGFALIGPFTAVGLYEVSRRRERGEQVSWLAALGVVRSPNFAAIVVLGLYLAAIFVVWIVVAHLVWAATLGPVAPDGVSAFLEAVFTTSAGWAMIVIGTFVGFCFALAVLVTSVISFPLLLDHNVGVPTAVVTSYRVFRRNPRVILAWGLTVAVLLLLGSIPAFVGLIIVLPVLGHATWHLYRRAIEV
ncbi:DUF2189 domain-containing protein [Maribius pontilimi]|uniref:DUF2189 domain-containing protein n=1 Tax=Palleronia pontilimi TaxID=1964209 RepID=A0A934IG06_9RHOB|nr:DUF2189 domain-containing protein [Palleronia pontilimi]MBJ3762208.1 DUF2189 domain-containing protein [Palleronia pontilimi]